VRTLAADLDLPILRTTPSSWIPAGVRDSVATISEIHDFVVQHDLGVVHLDEVDKFYQTSSSDWTRHVRGEAFDLLDGTIAKTNKKVRWSAATLKKLRCSFLIVGTGTWQSIWSQPDRPGLGFGPQAPQPDKAQQIKKDDCIPEELLRRFYQDLILIAPAMEEDFREASRQFGLTDLAARLGHKLDFAEAVSSGYGVRWLEGVFTQLLLLAEQQGSDLLSLRNPYPIEDIAPTRDELDDPILG
jgi:hypothetical protein